MAGLRAFLTGKAGRKKKKNVDLDRSSSTQLGSNTFSVTNGESPIPAVKILRRCSRSSMLREDLRSAFLVYVVDRNGAISAEELHQVLRSLGERTSVADCVDMIKGLASDGDGQVSFEELKTMMTKSL